MNSIVVHCLVCVRVFVCVRAVTQCVCEVGAKGG